MYPSSHRGATQLFADLGLRFHRYWCTLRQMSEPPAQPGGPARHRTFPAQLRGWKRRDESTGRYDPTTTDIVFVLVIGLSLLLLLFVIARS